MFYSSNIKICQWCHIKIEPTEVINYLLPNGWKHPVCSGYCYSRYSWKRANLDKFKNDPEDQRCVTCNTKKGGWYFNFNGRTFCSGIHMDIYDNGESKDLISRKKVLDEELCEISKKFLDIEKGLKERFNITIK